MYEYGGLCVCVSANVCSRLLLLFEDLCLSKWRVCACVFVRVCSRAWTWKRRDNTSQSGTALLRAQRTKLEEVVKSKLTRHSIQCSKHLFYDFSPEVLPD